MSISASGSVHSMRKSDPFSIDLIALRTRITGNGHFRPRAFNICISIRDLSAHRGGDILKRQQIAVGTDGVYSRKLDDHVAGAKQGLGSRIVKNDLRL